MRLLARHRADLLWALAIFMIAFAVRALFVAWINPDPSVGALNDAWFYHHAARAMADGRGYVFPGLGSPTAYWPPGYPALLSSAYLLPGPDLIAGKLLNAAIGAAGCALLYGLGRLAWHRAVGATAGLALAFFPSHIFFTTLVTTEVTFTTLLIGLAYAAVWLLRREPSRSWVAPLLLGLGIGVATMFRGEALLLPLVFGMAWLLTTRSWGRSAAVTALAAAGVAVVLGGWTVRNAVQLDAPAPLSTGSSVVWALAHWEGADGTPNRARSAEVLGYYEELPYPEREVKGSNKRLGEALEYMFTHPGHELTLIPRRVFELYRHDHIAVDWIAHNEERAGEDTLDALRVVSDVAYYALLALAIPGAWLWWRQRRAAALVLLGLAGYITVLIGLFFVGDQRYHASILPAFALFASETLVWAYAAARRGGTAAPSWGGAPEGGRFESKEAT